MPWLEATPMEQRERFIRDHAGGLFTMTELCARHTISRKTGYKWLERFDEGGRAALGDRSRAPLHMSASHGDGCGRADLQRPAAASELGAGKAAAVAGAAASRGRVASDSHRGRSVGARGIGEEAAPAPPSQHPGAVPATTAHPNDLWTTDFKGHFRTLDGLYCYPLTIADQHTRFLIACHGLGSTKGQGVRPVFDRLFRTHGLPRAIRTDNGVPFATTGIHGLSQLNVWWMRLGIQHQRILPGQPQQNGAHERMHKTLKAEAIRPPRATLVAQQRAFNRFRTEYNEERPHEYLRGATPAARYQPSSRSYDARLPPIEYPEHFLVKRITNAGTFRFKRRLPFISHALAPHTIGLEEVDDGIWSIDFCDVLLARLDERDSIIRS
jgi:putative transposase